ncbi:aminodeoxychorismate lyase [Marinomonas sp. 15G1-11]|uniref:Aminodeoxychorismate lyase n=1 Tax=Marinomonas phaeophyticola TaxID=3004091 RepID=A0ABT4JVK1_9GAMM|nr:aminodeoxychorismate lyase [Marinomonas sp. 15G1-11]MCZ2722246.1 aminodeoxychorismate lyase [Marinomonas sp. 15G1-11]
MATFLNYSPSNTLSLVDRSISYGDGLFETILVSNGSVQNLNGHLSRLSKGCLALRIPFGSDDLSKLAFFLNDLALSYTRSHVFKVIVTRGEGGRGYLPSAVAVPNVIISTSMAPDYTKIAQSGVALGVSSVPSNINRYLAGIKHLNRLENVMAKTNLTEGCFEDVMLDANGFVVECIQSNLFWFAEGGLKTPLLDGSGVQGTMRSRILVENECFPVEIGRYLVKDMQAADEIFITNSLMGIVPITNFIGQSFPIGINTRKIKVLLNC